MGNKDDGKTTDGNKTTSQVSQPGGPSRVLGNIGVYVVGAEPFENYLDRLEAFFAVNVTSDTDKVNSLIVLIGPEMYKTLKNLVVPSKPLDKTFDELLAVLKSHYSLGELEVAERYKFNSLVQGSHESVKDFIVALKQLATHCNFGSFLDEALRDRLVVGLRDEALIRRLLLEKKLTFNSACNIVQEIEVVQRQTSDIVSCSSGSRNVHGVSSKFNGTSQCQVSIPKKFSSQNSSGNKGLKYKANVGQNSFNGCVKPKSNSGQISKNQKCSKCNRMHSVKEGCPAATWVCFKCGKVGHVSSVCRTKVNLIEARPKCNNLSEDRLSKPVHCVPPLLSSIKVDKAMVNFEVDSGATLTLIPYFMYRKFFLHIPLESYDCKLTVANQQPLGTKGIMYVQVTHQGKTYKDCPVVVTDNNLQKALLGRDWLSMFNPNWKRVLLCDNSNSHESVNLIVDRPNCVDVLDQQEGHEVDFVLGLKANYPNIFSESNNEPIRKFQVDISLKENVVPIFHKA